MSFKKLNSKELYLTLFLVFIGTAMLILGPGGALDGQFFYTAGEADAYLRGLSASRVRPASVRRQFDLQASPIALVIAPLNVRLESSLLTEHLPINKPVSLENHGSHGFCEGSVQAYFVNFQVTGGPKPPYAFPQAIGKTVIVFPNQFGT